MHTPRAQASGPKQQRAHFQVHAGYHADDCAQPALDLQAAPASQPALGLRCRWAGCALAFAEDASGATLLAAHLSADHGAAPCHWAGCVRQPRGRFKTHVLSHLPEWYKPFQCSECGESYPKRNALTRHTNAAIWRNGCRKRHDSTIRVAGFSKRRKLDDREGHEASAVLPPSSPPSIGSSPLTSPTFSSPPPPESSSPPSSLPLVSSSPPPEHDAVAALDINNAALHSRLLSAEKLICEMQIEMDELRRAVHVSLHAPWVSCSCQWATATDYFRPHRSEGTPPNDRDYDVDWSLDD